MLTKSELEKCLCQLRRIVSTGPSPQWTRTSSAMLSARLRPTCQTTTRRGMSSETMRILYDGR